MGKYDQYYKLLNQWLKAKMYGHGAADYFHDLGYKNVAIYGMADLAQRLIDDLSNSDIEVRYGIDRDVACASAVIDDVYSPDDSLPTVDVIVVTPFTEFYSIKNSLDKCGLPIVSIEEVVWSI